MRVRLGTVFHHALFLAFTIGGSASAQMPTAVNPDELLLKSGVRVPALLRAQTSLASTTARHLLIQFESGRTKQGLTDLRARGVKVLEWVPQNAVSALVPPGVDPTAIPGVRWAGALLPSDKLAVAAAPIPEVKHVLVDFFPDVKRAVALRVIKRSGGKQIFNPYLRKNTLLVEIESADLAALAGNDEVSFIYPASKAVEKKGPIYSCPGPLTEVGPVANYVGNSDGWDGQGLGAAQLRYFFVNGTPDVANEQSEVTRALNVWSQFAAITWSTATLSGQARSLDFLWGSGDHGDGNAFDGPGQVLAHGYSPSPPNPEPIAGDVHFDEDELWRVGANVDLFSIALHEIGHAIGLAHSADPSAVMYPYYSGGVFSGLAPDDIAGIRSLYATVGGSSSDAFEPDDSASAAQSIAAGSQQSHSIMPATDIDFARFTLAGSADVTIEASGGSGDTRMWLYDASSAQLDFDDDSGVALFSRIDRSLAESNALPAGTYYVKVDEFGNNDTIANYNLSLQVVYHNLGDNFEPDGNASQAVPISSGVPQTHSIRPANDGDYTRFSLSGASEVVIETSGASGDTRMWLFAQDLSSVEFNDDGGFDLFSRIDRTQAEGNLLAPGTYYVLVDEFGNDNEIASYDILLSVTPLGGGDDAYEENDFVEEAWDAGFNWEGTWLSSLDGPGIQSDDDLYRIEVSPGFERVLVDCRFSHAAGDIDIYLLDAAGGVIGSSDGVADNEEIDVVVPAGGGTHYVVVTYGNAGNVYDLWWDDLARPVTGPSNDHFADRIGLSGLNASASGNNAGASKQSGEPDHAGVPGGVSLWWAWTAPRTGDVEINTSGSAFDTLLGVYTGTRVDALTQVASNDDVGTGLTSGVSFAATANTAYSIAVDGYNGSQGAITLTIAQQQPPPPTLQAAWSSLSSKCKASTSVCKLKGKLLVRNVSAGVSAAAQVSIYLSDDNTHDASDRSIGGGSVASLKVGMSKKVKLKATLPSGVAVSGKFVIAVVSSGGSTETVVFGPLF